MHHAEQLPLLPVQALHRHQLLRLANHRCGVEGEGGEERGAGGQLTVVHLFKPCWGEYKSRFQLYTSNTQLI